jgi:hypothetical protein
MLASEATTAINRISSNGVTGTKNLRKTQSIGADHVGLDLEEKNAMDYED